MSLDQKSYFFRPGVNFIVGGNATGKTTIFKCIKHALGLSVDLPFTPFRHLGLSVNIDGNEFRFTREGGSASVTIQSYGNIRNFRARSTDLDNFLQTALEPKFAIGSKLVSIFPLLEFCFLADEERINSRTLLSTLRLVCGANDKLISTAIKDVQALRSQIEADEEFLRRNDAFVDDFRQNLGAQPLEFSADVERSLSVARQNIERSVAQKRDVFDSSTVKIKELQIRNDQQFSNVIHEIEWTFEALQKTLAEPRIESVSFEEIVSRSTRSLSYGQAVSLDFLLFVSIARTKSMSDLNFPKIIVNDGMGSRSLDSMTLKKINTILEIQSRDDEDFQYIEFTHSMNVSSGHIVASLENQRWQI